MNLRNAIILGLGSDIADQLACRLMEDGWNIYGTYRTAVSPRLRSAIPSCHLLNIDISEYDSDRFIQWVESLPRWSLLVSAIGSQDPVGRFDEINLSQWVHGVSVNSLFQIAAVIECLKIRSDNASSVVFFAGGGTNGVTPNYSAQTLGKVTLIKAAELINSEYEDVTCFILGPGWVDTKIHASTLNSPEKSRDNYFKTLEMLSQKKCNPIEKVVDDILTLLQMPKHLVGGRNFSSVHDLISCDTLQKKYELNPDFYKLRRLMND